MEISFIEALKEYREMINIIIGGLLATLGGIVGIYFRAKNARRIKMDEIIAEKKVQANNEAYIKIKTIEGMLLQCSLTDTEKKIYDYDEWFFNARLFLPKKFPDKWLSLKDRLITVVGLERTLPDSADKIGEVQKDMNRLINEAIGEIYSEMRLSDIKIDRMFLKGNRRFKCVR